MESAGAKKRRRRHGTVYLDRSARDAHGRHPPHNEWRCEVTIKGVRYSYRSRSASAADRWRCEKFIDDMLMKHGPKGKRGGRGGVIPLLLGGKECEVRSMLKKGMSTRQIAKMFGVSPATVWRFEQRLRRGENARTF